MRITTNMMRRNYENSLQSSLLKQTQARNQVETGRKFMSSYEEPLSAARAVLLENRFARNADYQASVSNTMDWQDTQEDVIMQLNDIAEEIAKKYGMEALNDTNSSVRTEYAATFREMQRSMVQSLNAKFGNAYVMAGGGSEGNEAPFELTDTGDVLYRGLSLSDPASQAALDEMAAETSFIDFGIGLEFEPEFLADGVTPNPNAGAVVASTAFDASMPGINVVGYGHDANGVTNNMILIMGEMADILEDPNFNRGEYEMLWEKYTAKADELRVTFTEIGTKSKFMETTLSNLESEELNIIEQFDTTVNIDEAEAILNFSYSQYLYNATLKIGTSILSPSLLDFVQ